MVSGIGGSQNVNMSTRWQDFLKNADTDGDGKVSRAEFQAAMAQKSDGANADDLFSKLDTNGDGYIDTSEAATAQKTHHGHHHHGQQQATDPIQVFEQADQDGDGNIKKADFLAALPAGTDSKTAGQVFDSMDTNKDGVVSAAEYMAALGKTSQVNQLFARQSFSTLA
jgi:Ca2+-binding EF-hand superfamily protein